VLARDVVVDVNRRLERSARDILANVHVADLHAQGLLGGVGAVGHRQGKGHDGAHA
jgi:hypothetical protein